MNVQFALVVLSLAVSHANSMPMIRPSRRQILATAAVAYIGTPEVARADSMELSLNGPLVPGLSSPRLVSIGESAWSPPPLASELGNTRILAKELNPTQQMPFGDRELYYAPFLFGAWNVTATLKRKVYPYGTSFLPSKSLIEGSPRNRMEQVGDSTCYELHYFSTLANDFQNKLTVNLGLGVPKSKIIADRAFDAISISMAYKHFTPVQEVDWNPSKDPTHLSISFGAAPLAEDMRPLGKRRGEVYIVARQTETVSDTIFACSERSRSVILATGAVVVSDTEGITEYHKNDDNHITATSRIAVYLTPNPNSREGVLWQQVGGKAVAFFDYDIQMERILESFTLENGAKVEKACVKTPKDYMQCE